MTCAKCLRTFDPTTNPGGLLISPPQKVDVLGSTPRITFWSMVSKGHICAACWELLGVWLEAQPKQPEEPEPFVE